jgi:PHP family Zn ribbon phosphoesterase
MIRLEADLHIHTCLSPCAEDEMTPRNIVNMAALCGLEAIAVTDHNSARNLPAVDAACAKAGLLLIPGIEVQSREDVHLLCYFPTLDAALAFGAQIEAGLPPIKNNREIFGAQTVLDAHDAVVGEVEALLMQSVGFDIAQIHDLAATHGGLCVPAHINRQANSLLYTLGFFPASPVFTAVEVSRRAPAPTIDLGGYRVLYASDAHCLSELVDGGCVIALPERTAQAFISHYAAPKNP